MLIHRLKGGKCNHKSLLSSYWSWSPYNDNDNDTDNNDDNDSDDNADNNNDNHNDDDNDDTQLEKD